VAKGKDRSNARVARFRERARQADREKARAIAGSIVDGLPQQTIGRFLAAVEKDRRLALEHWAVATGENLTELPRDKRIAVEAWRRNFKVDAPDLLDILRPRLKPPKVRNGRPPDWYTQRNVVLKRISHQLVHERRHDETNVFDYTGDGLYWHIKAMQERPQTRRSKWRYPRVTPELQSECLARDAEEAHRNRATLLAILKAGRLDAAIAAVRRREVPKQTVRSWMPRWGSFNLRNKYWDEINAARWKLPLLDSGWWPVADVGSHGLALPSMDDWGTNQDSLVHRLARTIDLVATEAGWFPVGARWDNPEKRPNNLFWHRRSRAPDDAWQIAAERSGALIDGFSYGMRAFLAEHAQRRRKFTRVVKERKTPQGIHLLGRMELLRAHLGLAQQYEEILESPSTLAIERNAA
jgi:hypothetical protein